MYGENVAYVNREHVGLALWLRENTAPSSVIATHDIGATGYFSERYLVDIAGLATPELQTSTRDVGRVLEVLAARGVAYVAVMPDWYPPLTEELLRAGQYRRVSSPAEAFLVLERVR